MKNIDFVRTSVKTSHHINLLIPNWINVCHQYFESNSIIFDDNSVRVAILSYIRRDMNI